MGRGKSFVSSSSFPPKWNRNSIGTKVIPKEVRNQRSPKNLSPHVIMPQDKRLDKEVFGLIPREALGAICVSADNFGKERFRCPTLYEYDRRKRIYPKANRKIGGGKKMRGEKEMNRLWGKLQDL
ncbi:hypothetical protein HR08_09900 [Porphyromonas gulae]|uniref:Uncharacterized protein n=1 Tax=Porphyromonas gulae TaxID=111105 RepID=A0A0A2EYE5_9PORP|nr:hypothetical protein HR08_09900 [Porphyromonas gulae]